jgi:hypothetical protein
MNPASALANEMHWLYFFLTALCVTLIILLGTISVLPRTRRTIGCTALPANRDRYPSSRVHTYAVEIVDEHIRREHAGSLLLAVSRNLRQFWECLLKRHCMAA